MNGERLGNMEKIKLSEIKDDEVLLIDNGNWLLESKKEFLEKYSTKESRKDLDIYTTIKTNIELNAKDMIDLLLRSKKGYTYDQWEERIRKDITADDMNYFQDKLNEILNRNKEQNVNYKYDKLVENDLDIKEEKK